VCACLRVCMWCVCANVCECVRMCESCMCACVHVCVCVSIPVTQFEIRGATVLDIAVARDVLLS
jgi:hypothetical protein